MDPLHIPLITARCVDTQTLDEIEAHDRCWSSLADPAQPVWDCIDSIWGRPAHSRWNALSGDVG